MKAYRTKDPPPSLHHRFADLQTLTHTKNGEVWVGAWDVLGAGNGKGQ